jgi:CelD/BcsL family acetyltransferase involved in cellulose biosynthesis
MSEPRSGGVTGHPNVQLPIPDSQLAMRSEFDFTVHNVTVECVGETWGFTALRPRWNDLLRASSSDNPFLTWEWLNAWWSQYGDAGNLRLIVVRADDDVIAIAPFRLISAPLYWFSRLEFLGTGDAGSDYLDLIVKRGAEDAALTAIAQFLTSRKQAIRLTHLPPASLGARLATALADAGWVHTAADDGICPIVTLAGHTFESFLNSLGASHRANIRRRIRVLEQRFDVRFERVTSHSERMEMLAALARFHEARYGARGGSTAFSTATVRAFHDDATARALDRGWLRMYVLRLDGHVAAVMYGFYYGGRFYFYQHGYDGRYTSHSVGLVLMALTIRAALDEGAAEFDMLWGVEAYKSLWARESRVLRRVDLFPVDLGGTVHRRAVEARRGVSQLARRVFSCGFPGGPRGT